MHMEAHQMSLLLNDMSSGAVVLRDSERERPALLYSLAS